jgi:hypothetical protein
MNLGLSQCERDGLIRVSPLDPLILGLEPGSFRDGVMERILKISAAGRFEGQGLIGESDEDAYRNVRPNLSISDTLLDRLCGFVETRLRDGPNHRVWASQFIGLLHCSGTDEKELLLGRSARIMSLMNRETSVTFLSEIVVDYGNFQNRPVVGNTLIQTLEEVCRRWS